MSLLLALLLQAAPAAEPAWQSLGVFQGIETAYDPASVRADGGRVRVRVRGIAQNPRADGMRTVSGTSEIDCAAGTITALDARGYDSEGRLMFNGIVPAAERQAQPILPQSPNAAVRAQVCGSRGQ